MLQNNCEFFFFSWNTLLNEKLSNLKKIKMPFISKDWRSPGEVWVKTDDGWEKMKVLECRKRQRQVCNYV